MTIQEVMLQLLIKQPFYGYVAAGITPVESTSISTFKMSPYPSMKLHYNRQWFEGLEERHQIGVVLHELIHLIFLHAYRRENRDINLWTIACDMTVNEHIHKRYLHDEAITVDKIAKEIKETVPAKKSAETYYDIISASDQVLFFTTREEDIIIVIDSDKELKADKLSEDSLSDVNESALQNQLSQVMNDAFSEGESPEDMESLIDDIYIDFKVNWRQVLKRFLTGKGKIQTRKSYKRQSRRFENLPGTKRSVGIQALVAIDESGSISNGLVNKFYEELVTISKISGVEISVTRFDTECTPPVRLKEFIKTKNRMKSGGTDFRPIFKLADQMKIPLVIIFTDGDGKAPESVHQKTLWVINNREKRPAGFGHYVLFDS
ncbi:vWA domain-containing protein [Vallitalea okinawensis]|uniref:vWA domain-containing protein n=1 Tax=Vallitalea okinawensis TaxID=2078660 RepID=UPI000CFCC51E|nr:VWA-like domain-containing protein [Vallitalea okinawensis]